MKKPTLPSSLLLASAFLFVTFGLDTARAFSSLPPTGFTGAPGHSSCAVCHTSSGSGNVRISFSGGSTYEPGTLYTMLITITDPGQRRFGFSMVARDTDRNTTDVGTWLAGSPDTRVHGTQNSHVSHFNAPFVNDRHTFEVKWTAPATGVGDVTFYVAGNAANGNRSNGAGDNVYLNTLTISESVPNLPPSLSVPTGPLETTTGFPTPIAGISIDDPDAGDGILSVRLSVQNGVLDLADSVPGGVGPAAIDGNGSDSVVIDGTLAELNATFVDPLGVVYQSVPGFVAGEIVLLEANDNDPVDPQVATADLKITVNPPPTLSSFAVQPDGSVEFVLSGVPGLTYLVENSMDLEFWSPQETIRLESETAIIVDPDAIGIPTRIYRASPVAPGPR